MFRYLSASLLFLMPFLSVANGESFVESASIIANSIEIDAEGNLTAKGNVEVHYKAVSYTHLTLPTILLV